MYSSDDNQQWYAAVEDQVAKLDLENIYTAWINDEGDTLYCLSDVNGYTVDSTGDLYEISLTPGYALRRRCMPMV